MKGQKAFYMDASSCIGCKACELACKDKNNLPLGIRWRRVWDYGGGAWVWENGFLVPKGVFTYHLSAACMHCNQPACMEACPVDAISKRHDGIVLIDEIKCIGCRACEYECPYHAPQFDQARKIVTKCDFCHDLLRLGQKPVCVSICPQRCLDCGELNELRAAHGLVDAIEPLPESSLTGPSIVITPHRDAQKSGTGTDRVLTRDGF